MDQGLLAWARAVKQRRRSKLPVLWLFTDAARLPDPLPVIASLPKFMSGVVFRHDHDPERARLGGKIARLCKARHIALVVAGDARLAAKLGAGLHLRGGRRLGVMRPASRLITASVHNKIELRRAERENAEIAFISPAFATPSHPGENGLGPWRWVGMARGAKACKTYALGGVNSTKISRLADFCHGIGAISAIRSKINSNVT